MFLSHGVFIVIFIQTRKGFIQSMVSQLPTCCLSACSDWLMHSDASWEFDMGMILQMLYEPLYMEVNSSEMVDFLSYLPFFQWPHTVLQEQNHIRPKKTFFSIDCKIKQKQTHLKWSTGCLQPETWNMNLYFYAMD